MRTRVQHWLSAPIFPDEEQTRVAGLLNQLLIALILLLLLDAAVLVILAPETIPTMWINGVGVLLAGWLRGLMRQGRIHLAGIILCATLWPLTVYYLAISGGLSAPALGFLGLFVVVGVTLFGTRGALGMGLLNLIGLIGFYLAGRNGWLVSVEASPTLARLFATNSMLIFLMSALVMISGRNIRSALARARSGELALEEHNQALNREIAERKLVEDTLRRNEASMRAILDNSALSYVLMDIDQRVIIANRIAQLGAQTVFGRKIQAGDPFTEFLSVSNADDFQQNFKLALRGQTTLSKQSFLTPQGQTRKFDFRYFPALAVDGRVLGVCLSSQDVTEREQAENALRESEQKFRALSEQSLIGISIMQDHQLKYVNQAVANINGYSVEEMLGWGQIDFGRTVHPDDLTFATDWALGKQGDDPNTVSHFQFRIITKTGQVAWVEQFSKTIEFDGKPANLGILIDITERQQMEDALRQSEERYRVISEMISDYAFSVRFNPDGTTESEWITESFTRMTGYTEAETIALEGHQRFALFHPDDQARLDADMARLLQGTAVDDEYRMISKTGETRWMHFYRHPVWDDNHQRVMRYYGVAQDITERTHAQQALQRRDAILEAVSTAADYFLKAADWRLEIVNILAILGKAALVDRADIFQSHHNGQGRLLASLRYEWNAPGIQPIAQNPLAQNVDLSEIELRPTIDQIAVRQPVYFHVKDRPVENRVLGDSTGTKTFSFHPILSHGGFWGALVLSTTIAERDWSRGELDALQIAADMLGTVMERKQAEEALHQTASRLNMLHQIDQAILGAATAEGIAQAALRHIRQLIPCQYAAIELVDHDTAERVMLAVDTDGARQEDSQPPGGRCPLDPTWLQTFKERQNYVIADVRSASPLLPVFQSLVGQTIRSLAILPLVAHNKFLGSLNLMANEPAVFSQDYLAIGREVADQLAIAIDQAHLYELTQRHAVELEKRVKDRTAQLETANNTLQVLSRMKDEFVSNVSHELRTPISSIKLRAFLLSQQLDKVDLHMPVIQRETERLARIIEDLLSLSRMDQDRAEFRLVSVDLNYLMSRFVADRVPIAESRGLALKATLAPELSPIQADSGLLEQVLSILMTNALNYTPPGGEVFVGTQMRRVADRQQIGFNVSDTGPGINREEQNKLFVRFFRGQAAKESGVAGTGLGLALAKEIIDRHNGWIEVESEGLAGKGTTFRVWFTVPA